MIISAAATHVIPAAMITHSTVLIKGQQHATDITVHHARTAETQSSRSSGSPPACR